LYIYFKGLLNKKPGSRVNKLSGKIIRFYMDCHGDLRSPRNDMLDVSPVKHHIPPTIEEPLKTDA